ncbi:hypothetical protein VNO77_33539 [Canavalia gladiata]|uniref:Uncharacterized protein n=1 Tax=Canavalia gladiata TaxID=3824 RepID=A0AAN9KF28_CANGL
MISASMHGKSSVRIQLSLEHFCSSMPIAWLVLYSLTGKAPFNRTSLRTYRKTLPTHLARLKSRSMRWKQCNDLALLPKDLDRKMKALMLPGVVVRSFVVYFFELSLRGDSWRQGELPLKYWVLLLKVKPAKLPYESLKEMWP